MVHFHSQVTTLPANQCQRAQTLLKIIEFYTVHIIEVIMPDWSSNAPREKKNPLSGSPQMVEKSELTVGEQSRIGGTPTPNEGSGMTSSFHFPSEGACHQE